MILILVNSSEQVLVFVYGVSYTQACSKARSGTVSMLCWVEDLAVMARSLNLIKNIIGRRYCVAVEEQLAQG